MKTLNRITVPSLLIVALLAAGCLLPGQGVLQTLVLFFELTQTIPEGGEFLAHTSTYPNQVKLKGQFVRISGVLEPAPSATRVTVKAIGVDPTTGKQTHKFQTTVSIGPDGSYSALKKFNKNIQPGTVQTITIEPLDGDIAADTRVGICVDVTKKKADFTAANSCATAASPPGDDSEFVLIEVQDHAFSPKSVTIQPGETVRWQLTGSNLSHTVTAMSGAFDSGFVFDSQGAFFERTFPQTEDGQTFEYSCVTHKECCEMQGSVLVGSNASPPSDGY